MVWAVPSWNGGVISSGPVGRTVATLVVVLGVPAVTARLAGALGVLFRVLLVPDRRTGRSARHLAAETGVLTGWCGRHAGAA
jgi:hypothetical protein